MKSAHKLIILTLCLLISSTKSHCPPGSVLRVLDDFSSTCLKCPDGCAICSLNALHEPYCIFCEDGYFTSPDQRCLKCFENCASCIGSEMTECRTLKSGFYYDSIQYKIKPCVQAGCASCSSDSLCHSCSEGYYLADVSASTTKVCKPCELNGCLVCSEKDGDIKNLKIIACNVCKSGHSLVNEKCEPCPENCQFCIEDSKECILCKPGFSIENKSNNCAPIQISNCNSLDVDGKCVGCENRFYLQDNSCSPCQRLLPNCSFCRSDITSNVLSCMNCETGFFLQGNTCKKCSENCNHCTADRCSFCMKGYFFDESARNCIPCSISNCDLCKTATFCESCLPGYYFDEVTSACVR